MYSLCQISLMASTFWITGAMCFPLCGTESPRPSNGAEMKVEAVISGESLSMLHNSCCSSCSSIDSRSLEKSAQSSYAEENDNRVWMLTAEGIQSNLVQYNRVIPGHKYIINNVGGRRLKFGPEDPPQQYVTILGEYDCLGLLAPLKTLFPKAALERKWWTHQTRPHEKWIFNAPCLGEAAGLARGFCITVTDVETGKTAEVKIRVGTLTQF